MPNVLHDKLCSYEDYLTWSDKEKIEIIEGEIFSMSPAPLRIHQEVLFEIATKIKNHISKNNGKFKVYIAPFDVRFYDESKEYKEIKNVVQPDISVICNENKLDDRGCIGSPDMIVEIVSPSNASVDYIYKLNLYNKYKVKEYWIVNPRNKSIIVYKLNESGQYGEPEMYGKNDKIEVSIFENFTIDFSYILIH